MVDTTSSIVVDKQNPTSGGFEWKSKYNSILIIIVLLVIVVAVYYCKDSESFTSPDGVVSRRSQRQVRSDAEVDKAWNIKELERSVALLNRKSGAHN